jgi:S-adenosyl-L-methionine hydrolase (adenosine-forming)
VPIPILTFISDFGYEDWFVGVVHGAVHEICPEARVVNMTHAIPPGHVERAAFVLEAAAPDFPPGTVHLAVVDPGVGTSRRALAARAHGQLFVGPDNGLLEWAFRDPAAEVRQLTEQRWFRLPVSRTFHGRDVFAPVAAHLACGVPFASFGAVVSDPLRLERKVPQPSDGWVPGRVMFIDRFGNALTSITEQELSDAFPTAPAARLEVRAAGRVIRGLARSYADAPVGTLLAIIGSSGRLEIAQVGGDASVRLGLAPGDLVGVRVGS